MVAPASQQEVVAAEAEAVMAPTSQQAKALLSDLKAPPAEAAERCSPVTAWAT